MIVNPDVGAFVKPEITGQYSKKREKQQPTENQKNIKPINKLDPDFYT